MKKIYQTPATITTVVELQQMIAASPLGNPEDGFTMTVAPETEATSGNMSRRRSVWGDEEEDF